MSQAGNKMEQTEKNQISSNQTNFNFRSSYSKIRFLSSALPLQHPFSLPAKVLAMCKHEADFTCCKVQVPPGFEDGIALKMLFNALFNARGVKL